MAAATVERKTATHPAQKPEPWEKGKRNRGVNLEVKKTGRKEGGGPLDPREKKIRHCSVSERKKKRPSAALSGGKVEGWKGRGRVKSE